MVQNRTVVVVAVIAVIVIFVLSSSKSPFSGEAIRQPRIKIPTMAERQTFCCQYSCLPSSLPAWPGCMRACMRTTCTAEIAIPAADAFGQDMPRTMGATREIGGSPGSVFNTPLRSCCVIHCNELGGSGSEHNKCVDECVAGGYAGCSGR